MSPHSSASSMASLIRRAAPRSQVHFRRTVPAKAANRFLIISTFLRLLMAGQLIVGLLGLHDVATGHVSVNNVADLMGVSRVVSLATADTSTIACARASPPVMQPNQASERTKKAAPSFVCHLNRPSCGFLGRSMPVFCFRDAPIQYPIDNPRHRLESIPPATVAKVFHVVGIGSPHIMMTMPTRMPHVVRTGNRTSGSTVSDEGCR